MVVIKVFVVAVFGINATFLAVSCAVFYTMVVSIVVGVFVSAVISVVISIFVIVKSFALISWVFLPW